MHVQIVPFTDEHLASYHRCLDGVARERRWLGLVAAPPLRESDAWMRDGRERGMVMFVALADGEVVGWCDVTPHRLEGFRHVGELGMGVAANHRRQGVGARLLDAAVDAARAAGLEKIELHAFAANTAAVALYKKHGFVVEGRKLRTRKLDGVYDDVLLMARFLDAP